jgi:hypothetical protein
MMMIVECSILLANSRHYSGKTIIPEKNKLTNSYFYDKNLLAVTLVVANSGFLTMLRSTCVFVVQHGQKLSNLIG